MMKTITIHANNYTSIRRRVALFHWSARANTGTYGNNGIVYIIIRHTTKYHIIRVYIAIYTGGSREIHINIIIL